MTGQAFLGRFHELWADIHQPDVLWQGGALLVALVVAALAASLVRRRTGYEGRTGAARLGRGGLQRLAFPLIALVLVVIARAAIGSFAHIKLLDLAVPLLGSMAAVRIVVYILRYALAPSGWLAASERIIATTIWSAVAIYLVGLGPALVGALQQVQLPVGKETVDLWMILKGLLMVLVTVLLALWVGGLIEARLMAARDMDSSVRVVLVRVAKALLALMAVLFSLSLVGIDITALSVFGGALGVGLGFGLQKIASNYVSGFIILLDRSIQIGNVVTIDPTTTGVVTEITTRYTVVRLLSGVEVIVPNEYLVANIVQNQSHSDTKVRVAVAVQVAYRSDLPAVIALLEKIANEHPRVIAEPAPRAVVTAFADSGINLELGFWIEDPQEGTGGVRSEISVAIWKAFREQEIEIPFPQREVRLVGPASAT